MPAFPVEKTPLFLASIAANLMFLISSAWATQDQTATANPQDPSTWHIDFPGGSVEEYVQLIRETAPKDSYPVINIVIAETSSGFQLPAIDATADLDGFIGCIESCSTSRYQIEVRTDDRTGNITIIRVIAMESRPTSRVYNVGHIIKAIPEADLVSAVSLALEFADSSSGVEMKLHKETGLLFAKGQETGLDAIEATVKELEQGLFGATGPAIQSSLPGVGGGGGGMAGGLSPGVGGDSVPKGSDSAFGDGKRK